MGTENFVTKILLIWCLFFTICLSLGYPTLNRYDPATANLSDVVHYKDLVVNGFSAAEDNHWRYRVVVPYLAKPFYLLSQGRIGSWDPVAFGLLVANSIFVASAGIVLLSITLQLIGDLRAGLLTGLLFLSNFNVSNLYLAGLIDSGEVFLMCLIAWALLNKRWQTLPLIAVFCGITKETCIPISGSLAFGWFLFDSWKEKFEAKKLIYIFLLGLISLASLAAIKIAGNPEISWPWDNLTESSFEVVSFLSEFFGLMVNRNIFYTFIWLLPLGILGLKYLPAGWIWGSALSAFVILILSAGIGVGDNIGRPMFSAMGPVLVVSASLFIWNVFAKTSVKTN